MCFCTFEIALFFSNFIALCPRMWFGAPHRKKNHSDYYLIFFFQAILIAFTSEFIPKLVYKYEHDWNMSGYVNFTLATSPNEGWNNNLEDTQCSKIEKKCKIAVFAFSKMAKNQFLHQKKV